MNSERETGMEANRERVSDRSRTAESSSGEPESVGFRVSDNRHWAREDGAEDDGEERPRRPAYVEELERKLADQEEQLQQYIAAYKEFRLETEATKNRLEKEVRRTLEWERATSWKPFLDVMDNLRRMTEHARETRDLDALVQGCEMISRQFAELLSQEGLEVVGAVGEPFDPNRHEAIGMVPVDDPAQAGRVTAIQSDGYQLNGKLVRPARVLVGQGPSAEN